MLLIDVSEERSVESVLKRVLRFAGAISLCPLIALYDWPCSTTIAAVVILYAQLKTLHPVR
jgi:hypothetical protein